MLRDDGRDGWFWVKEGEERILYYSEIELGHLCGSV